MPKPSQKVELKSLAKGIITEAGPLAFPADATLDDQNFDLSRSSVRSRRNGIDFEPGYVSRTFVPRFNSISLGVWLSVNGDPSFDILVVQSGTALFFFDKSADDISNSGYLGTLALSEFPESASTEGARFAYTSVEGLLIVAGGEGSIAILSYVGGVFSVSYENLQVRDVWGVEVT